MEYLKKNYHDIISVVEDQAKLLVVTKTRSLDEISYLYDLGHRDFGENRVDELLQKAISLPKDISWHFIGNLQSKKIPKLLKLENLKYIHSVSSLSLLEKLNSCKAKLFLQVNTSGETQKSGFEPSISVLQNALSQLKTNQVIGLMTMGRIRTDDIKKEAENCFNLLKDLRDSLDSSLELSMGMSSDYEVALSIGTDWLRIGSLLFKS